ncbi:hypothetical protein Tco_0916330 [Tanacetum coccineum]
MELHDVSYGIEYVARPLLLFFSFENRLLWFRYREYDLAHLKLVFEFSIYNVWKSVQYGELALMCARMFLEESDNNEKYVSGLPDMIHGSVMASNLKTMQDAIEFVAELMDKKIRTFAERQSENKRKQDDNQQ